jgi:hypothetical protein
LGEIELGIAKQTIKTPKLTYTHTAPTLHPIHPIDQNLFVHSKTHHGVSHALSPGLHSELYVAVKGDNGAVEWLSHHWKLDRSDTFFTRHKYH